MRYIHRTEVYVITIEAEEAIAHFSSSGLPKFQILFTDFKTPLRVFGQISSRF